MFSKRDNNKFSWKWIMTTVDSGWIWTRRPRVLYDSTCSIGWAIRLHGGLFEHSLNGPFFVVHTNNSVSTWCPGKLFYNLIIINRQPLEIPGLWYARRAELHAIRRVLRGATAISVVIREIMPTEQTVADKQQYCRQRGGFLPGTFHKNYHKRSLLSLWCAKYFP